MSEKDLETPLKEQKQENIQEGEQEQVKETKPAAEEAAKAQDPQEPLQEPEPQEIPETVEEPESPEEEASQEEPEKTPEEEPEKEPEKKPEKKRWWRWGKKKEKKPEKAPETSQEEPEENQPEPEEVQPEEEKPEKAERKAERPEQPGKPEREEKPEKPEKPEKAEEPEKPKAKNAGRSHKKRKKRKKSKNYLLRILIVMGLIAALFAVMHLDYFTVTKVTVTGNDLLSKEEILKGTEIKKGENIFDIHFFMEKGKIKENLYVQDVKLSRKLPDKIIVTVTERSGLAQIKGGEKFTVVDNSGRVIDVSKEQKEIPLLFGFEPIDSQRGNKIKLRDDKGFDKALALIASLDENDMFLKSIEITDGRVKATVFGKLKVKGSYDNVMDAIESGTLKTVVYDLYQKGKKKGTIIVSGDNYCSFTE